MKYQINSTGEVIVADLAFVEALYPNDFTEVVEDALPPVAEPVTPWSKKDLLLKFSPTEYAGIKSAASVSPEIDYYWTLFTVSGDVLKTDPVTIAGINALESAGLLAVGRAAEILQ